MNITIKEAIEFFMDHRDIIPIFTMPKGDYAVPAKLRGDLYLVVEKNAPGIFLARLEPDLLRLTEIDEETADNARDFIYQRLQHANLTD